MPVRRISKVRANLVISGECGLTHSQVLDKFLVHCRSGNFRGLLFHVKYFVV